MRLEEILNLSPSDIAKLSKPQLEQLQKQLSVAANLRVTRLKKSGLYSVSPAYKEKYVGEKFKYEDLTLNQLRNEFKRTSAFLNLQTSTVTGTKKYIGRMSMSLKRRGIDTKGWATEDWQRFFRLYRLAQQAHPDMVSQLGSNSVQRLVRDFMQNDYFSDDEDFLDWLDNRITAEYEELQEDFPDGNDLDDDDFWNVGSYS